MTNYRLRVPKNQMGEWKCCFTCGLPLERRRDLETGLSDGELEVWGCSMKAFHLLIWVTDDEEGEPEFI